MEEKRELPEGVKEEMGGMYLLRSDVHVCECRTRYGAVKRSSDGEMHLQGSKELAGAAETCGEGSQENRKNLC